MFGTTVYASSNLTPNELLHVHCLGEVGCITQKLLLVLRATRLEVDGEGISELHLVLQASPRSAS